MSAIQALNTDSPLNALQSAIRHRLLNGISNTEIMCETICIYRFWNGQPIEDRVDGWQVRDMRTDDDGSSTDNDDRIERVTKSQLKTSTRSRSGTIGCLASNAEGSQEVQVQVKINGPGMNIYESK